MSDFEKFGASEAKAFEEGGTIFDAQKRQLRAAERTAAELIEIKYLLKALVENERVKRADAGEEK